MKGGDVATCPTFHMGNGSICQCIDRSGRQPIEKEKILAFGYQTCDRRWKMQKRKNKENADEEDKKKVCAFHLIVHVFSNLVCFGTAFQIWVDKAQKMVQIAQFHQR